MMKKNVKIILVGSRYTGKGQIGRVWGKTSADLPTLQPVILYERMIGHMSKMHRVVAWVLSFDSEFKELRSSFYNHPDPDGIIFTYDVNDSSQQTVRHMDEFKDEILGKLDSLPPAVLFGIRLTKARERSQETVNEAKKWANKLGIGDIFESTYEDTELFEKTVEEAFTALLDRILN